MHHYRISGLSVESEIALPGMIEPPETPAAFDVAVRCAEVPAELPDAVAEGPTWKLSADRVLIDVPGVARFLVSDGREIKVATGAGSTADDAAIFVLGTVFGILLHQRRAMVLHASAIAVGGKAVLFCGRSGAGKSTLAASLAQRGYPFLADDVCTLGFDAAGTPVVQPDGKKLKLWAQAVDRLGLEENRGQGIRNRIEKFYVEPPGEVLSEPMPVGAIYQIRETRPPLVTGIERPNVVDATLILRRNAYRPLLVARMGQAGIQFQNVTAVAARAGIFNLTRPQDFSALPAVLDMLERHWAEIGLAAPPT